ncbi:MAG: phage shock protein PspA [Gammaproteobacteria bacterium]|nr:phage shock protein PspA [Gammaproteobacteria bacterium]
MGIFSRISDIINSNINALLDSAEDPEKMVRLVIQEMEETLVEVRTNSARLLADKKELTRRFERLVKQSSDWQSKAELALSKGREDLAKLALIEKSEVNDIIEAIESDRAKLEETLNKLTEDIELLQLKLNEAKSRQKIIVMRTRATESRVTVNRKLRDNDVEMAISKLDYFEKKIDQMESQIEADAIGNSSLHKEFDDLEMQDKIDQELQELKSRISDTSKPDVESESAATSAKK